ncbi:MULTISPECIES: 50S ribosomal protein L23 [Larsenimonas]|uniref:Large ribosomal subunit protein uL23 n=1 Tax=Larsenimonas suaedae TaxID=1851019 RepID=A0ABU1GYV7_9GAMM|nr:MULTISPECIES: 50S ribosomal protein L23 [Larsenimonas]MCM2973642.1 50S ribosomal protein L23 [Larsenimonas suaedae]MCM5705464.1 50S ribosomal protein L23 [Larsenimonas salina]MDR5897224.1 50S ribosomal protein L23 [Larsenimonas suaedae]
MNQERIFKVLLGPHMTEKAASVAENSNQYVFKVAADATKPEIKKAVESLFETKVAGVQVLNMKGKVKRSIRGEGRRQGYRKAYVTLAQGETLDDFTGNE